MSGDLFGDRYAGRQPAWHGLGTVFTEPKTAVEALEIGGLDYNINTIPITVQSHGHNIVTDKVALVREPTTDDPEPRMFGIVGKGYMPVQNRQLAEMLDVLTETWPVETVGALGYGERVFFSLKVGSGSVKGEDIEEYFLLTEGKTGGDAVKLIYTPVRVVCRNTLISGLRAGTVSASIPHLEKVKEKLSWHLDLMPLMKNAQRETLATFEAMANVSLLEAQVTDIINTAYAYPTEPKRMRLTGLVSEGPAYDDLMKVTERYDYYKTYSDRQRETAMQLYVRICDECPDIARTPWAVYNAVVELEDYGRQGKNPEKLTSIAESTLFGVRAATKVRAFKVAAGYAFAK